MIYYCGNTCLEPENTALTAPSPGLSSPLGETPPHHYLPLGQHRRLSFPPRLRSVSQSVGNETKLEALTASIYAIIEGNREQLPYFWVYGWRLVPVGGPRYLDALSRLPNAMPFPRTNNKQTDKRQKQTDNRYKCIWNLILKKMIIMKYAANISDVTHTYKWMDHNICPYVCG